LQEIVSRVLNTYFLGEHIGSKWGLGRVMRWTPTIAASMLLDEARGDKTKLLKDVGLYKVQGDAATAVMGAIFQQFVSSFIAFRRYLHLPENRVRRLPTASSTRASCHDFSPRTAAYLCVSTLTRKRRVRVSAAPMEI
jgi:hypothetical protein